MNILDELVENGCDFYSKTYGDGNITRTIHFSNSGSGYYMNGVITFFRDERASYTINHLNHGGRMVRKKIRYNLPLEKRREGVFDFIGSL